MDLHLSPHRPDGPHPAPPERPGRRNFFQLIDPRGKVCLALQDGEFTRYLPEGAHCPRADMGEVCPACCQQLSLLPGISLYTACFRCPASQEYDFQINDDHVYLSYCTEGQSCTEVSLGPRNIQGIAQTPATCTASYLPQARGRWRPMRGACRLLSLRLEVNQFEELYGQLRRALGREQRNLPPASAPFFIAAPANPALMMAAGGLENAMANGPRVELLIQCKALELAMLILAQLHQNKTPAPCDDTPLSKDDVENLRTAREILRVNLSEPPSLTQLARQAGINEFKLKRGFRRLFGLTPYGFLREERLEQARRYLESGDMNVYEACLAVGYSNPGHFSGAFKRRFGVTPGGVRQRALRAVTPLDPGGA